VAGRRPAGWGRFQRVVNGSEHAFEIPIDIAIPKSQHAKTECLQVAIADAVLLGVRIIIVLTAIKFDDQPLLEARKIDDVPCARCLAAEMEAAAFP
jgi:hypothetical protein